MMSRENSIVLKHGAHIYNVIDKLVIVVTTLINIFIFSKFGDIYLKSLTTNIFLSRYCTQKNSLRKLSIIII